ncbi:Transmembrane domain-containing protein [Spironucleus salmonicida]|uniref:Transmembrane domain-containing protein n=1 Tax=Spironucleus salmonicida TaxID=348837 RepID=V6LDM9_9EUKA|nr:Transmembrane domain-containing protein [Spironucleus salmonicida]|eukprot:EST41781.1 Transmembrane domain-containing protein [Spironucleus salmonicida]
MEADRLEQSGKYLLSMVTFLLCYGYLSSPNLYSFFYGIFTIIFISKTNIFIHILIIMGAVGVPISFYFLEDDYVMLNMLTYFPYPQEKYIYQILASVVLTWSLFIFFYVLYFQSQKNSDTVQGLGTVFRELRNQQLQ